MTSPGDRPAAELLGEWQEVLHWRNKRMNEGWMVENVGPVLARLARAEHALAAVAALHTQGSAEFPFCDGCEFPFPCRTVRALRASQGGQT